MEVRLEIANRTLIKTGYEYYCEMRKKRSSQQMQIAMREND